MSIPRNLSILADGANSSGVLLANSGGTGLTSPGTNGNVLTSNGTAWTSAAISAGGFTLGTPIALTSQSSISFTGIPSNAKTVQINFSNIGFSGADGPGVKLGTSGGLVSSGYTSTSYKNSFGPTNTTGYFWMYTNITTPAINGTMFLNLVDATNNIWVVNFQTVYLGVGNYEYLFGAGAVTLSGALTQLSIFPALGNNFAQGTINICYGT